MAPHPQIERTKSVLLETFESFLADRSADQIARFRVAIRALLDRTPELELLRVVERVSTTGEDW